MRILLLFLLVLALIQDAFVAPEQELYCKHLYNKVAHVTIEQPDPESIVDLDMDEEEMNKNEMKHNDTPIVITVTDDFGATVQREKCSSSNFCYALWQTESTPNGTNIIIMGQGCWAGSNGKQECERSECISDKKPPKAANNTKFCCCSGYLCNTNFTDAYVPSVDDLDDPKILLPASDFLEQSRKEHQMIILIAVGACLITIGLVGAFIICNKQHIGFLINPINTKGAPIDGVNLMEGGGGPRFANGFYCVDHLKLIGRIGQGRYGSVWKGTVNEQEVAVKIFPAHYRNYYYNERDIYCLPFMDNAALLTYYGCDERSNLDGQMEYLLILSYAPYGCLQEYLKEHVLDWVTFCRMALSVAKGLAHLHTDIIKGDKIKPCVSHRDLNSRNVLVKNDLTCCLCDLGFAMKISNSKYYNNGEEQQEPKSLSEVGTLRYMAPEVLEGAVNLLDCESSLKQIDVYALGLVLWELATRCTDLYPPGVEIPPYKLPFENEVGLHPTFEQMQTVVSRHKARPLWPPEAWNGRWGASAAHRLVRETTEDCWDQDAEARLTALCVEERLHELPHVKDRGNRGPIYTSTSVSPTLNQTQVGISQIINNNHINSITSAPNMTLHFVNQESTGNSVVSQPSVGKDQNDISESTIETMYTMTPSDVLPPSNEHISKNSNQTAQQFIQTNMVAATQQILQPFQGRNPCMERNLLISSGSIEDIQYPTTLIDKSFKHLSYYRPNSDTQNLIGHDFLNQNGGGTTTNITINGLNSLHTNANVVTSSMTNRPATPIPYVQNMVYETNSTSYTPVPKTQNTPSFNITTNTQQHAAAQQQQNESHSSSSSKSNGGIFGWSGWKKLLEKKKIFSRDKLDNGSGGGCAGGGNNTIEEPEIKSNLLSKEDLHQSSRKFGSNPIIVDTQVNLVPNKMMNGFTGKQNGGSNVVITSVLPISDVQRSDSSKSNKQRPSTLSIDMKTTTTTTSTHNISIYNESNPLSNQKFTAVPLEHQLLTDLDNVKNGEIDENTQLLPPSSAADKTKQHAKITSAGISQVIKRRKSLSREGSFDQFNEVFSSNTDLSRLKDPNQRIKTPGDVPPSVRRNRGRANSSNSARFSLYDDRMMSVNRYEGDTCEQSWSNSVPDGIGISINYPNDNNSNNNNAKSRAVENLVVANRTDSVSSF